MNKPNTTLMTRNMRYIDRYKEYLNDYEWIDIEMISKYLEDIRNNLSSRIPKV